MENNTLTHHGILGQKWGVRRFQNEDGSLTARGKRKYALKGFEEDSYNSNKTKLGKIYDRLTDAHKYGGAALYGVSSQKERDARAEKYVNDHIKKQSKLSEKDDRKEALKNRRTLSDTELKKRIERLQTEKRLKDLTEADLNPGKAAVKEVLANSGKKVASALITGATLYAVKSAMTGKFDINEAASYMTPKPKNK